MVILDITYEEFVCLVSHYNYQEDVNDRPHLAAVSKSLLAVPGTPRTPPPTLLPGRAIADPSRPLAGLI